MEEKATIYDVAARAGVSASTVSRVLNDSSRVKDSTRVRVQKAIEALGYRPSRAAQRLSLSRRAPSVSPSLDNKQRELLRDLLKEELEQVEGRIHFEGDWPPEERNRVRRTIGEVRKAAVPIVHNDPEDFWICTSFQLAGRKIYMALPLVERARFIQAFSVEELIGQLSALGV